MHEIISSILGFEISFLLGLACVSLFRIRDAPIFPITKDLYIEKKELKKLRYLLPSAQPPSCLTLQLK